MPIIKPNPNKKVEGKPLQVFDPVRKDFLPVEGREVPNSEYWTRRLSDGSVVKIDAVEKKKKTSTAKKETEKTTEVSSGSADETAPEDNANDKEED